ncbi:hypothetical protein BSKO_07349 [Bryopsis sp. KO-2023]|nr:hypothetical protein BSKO_07349 [Bryopsis sp. KO-2023]
MAASPPEIFVCPISRDLMHDPVVLVETGQIYDRGSIKGWFERGSFTCPMTGTRLVTRNVSALHSLRENIVKWAEETKVPLEPPEFSLGEGEQELMCLDTPAESLSLVLAKGVSIYDIQGLCRLVSNRNVPEAYAAMVVLRDLVRHSNMQHLRQAEKVLDIGMLKGLLWEDNLQIPAGRLLTQIKGALDMDELLSLLVIQNVELQVDVLTRLVEHICENRGHMQVAAGAFRRWVSGLISRLKRSNTNRRQRSRSMH